MKIDETDRRILAVLQDDATIALDSLGEKVGLSRNACWRRVKALESAGVIARRVTLLDASKVGLDVTVFLRIRAGKTDSAWRSRFGRVVADCPEILEVYRMSTEDDYLLRVKVADVAGYNALYRKLTDRVQLDGASAGFVLEEVKYSTALPL